MLTEWNRLSRSQKAPPATTPTSGCARSPPFARWPNGWNCSRSSRHESSAGPGRTSPAVSASPSRRCTASTAARQGGGDVRAFHRDRPPRRRPGPAGNHPFLRGPAPRGHIPFTPRAKKSLEFSLREAKALHDNYIGVQHITLALLALKDGTVPVILSE